MRRKKISSKDRYALPLLVCVPLFFLGVYFLVDYKNSGYNFAMFVMFIFTWFVWIAIVSNSSQGDISSSLYSRPDNADSQQKHWVKVSEVSNDSISTYPRFTIYHTNENNSLIETEKDLIFDSSDFEVISHSFGSAKGAERTLKEGDKIVINENIYTVLNLKVCFMNLFHDYSPIYSGMGGHTDIYTGIDIPYNIQIIATVKFISKIEKK